VHVTWGDGAETGRDATDLDGNRTVFAGSFIPELARSIGPPTQGRAVRGDGAIVPGAGDNCLNIRREAENVDGDRAGAPGTIDSELAVAIVAPTVDRARAGKRAAVAVAGGDLLNR
jgi:hypothetical protein